MFLMAWLFITWVDKRRDTRSWEWKRHQSVIRDSKGIDNDDIKTSIVV